MALMSDDMFQGVTELFGQPTVSHKDNADHRAATLLPGIGVEYLGLLLPVRPARPEAVTPLLRFPMVMRSIERPPVFHRLLPHDKGAYLVNAACVDKPKTAMIGVILSHR